MAAIVHSPDGLSLKDLSAHLGLAHSITSGIVDHLESRGLAQRKQDENDARLTRIVASPQVSKFLVETMPKLAIHPLVDALRDAKPGERAAIAEGSKRCEPFWSAKKSSASQYFTRW